MGGEISTEAYKIREPERTCWHQSRPWISSSAAHLQVRAEAGRGIKATGVRQAQVCAPAPRLFCLPTCPSFHACSPGSTEACKGNGTGMCILSRAGFCFPTGLTAHPNRIKIEADLGLLISNANYSKTATAEHALEDY